MSPKGADACQKNPQSGYAVLLSPPAQIWHCTDSMIKTIALLFMLSVTQLAFGQTCQVDFNATDTIRFEISQIGPGQTTPTKDPVYMVLKLTTYDVFMQKNMPDGGLLTRKVESTAKPELGHSAAVAIPAQLGDANAPLLTVDISLSSLAQAMVSAQHPDHAEITLELHAKDGVGSEGTLIYHEAIPVNDLATQVENGPCSNGINGHAQYNGNTNLYIMRHILKITNNK